MQCKSVQTRQHVQTSAMQMSWHKHLWKMCGANQWIVYMCMLTVTSAVFVKPTHMCTKRSIQTSSMHVNHHQFAFNLWQEGSCSERIKIIIASCCFTFHSVFIAPSFLAARALDNKQLSRAKISPECENTVKHISVNQKRACFPHSFDFSLHLQILLAILRLF